MNAKQFLTKVRKLNINPRLSPDKTFVIYEPSLSIDMVQQAIDLTDDLCLLLDNESILLSDDTAELIESLVDNDDIMSHTSFRLTDPSNINVERLPIVYEEMTSESFNADFDFIRKNLKDVINLGTDALQRMILVAQESQHPRAYEVVATLIKTISDSNKDLLESHKKKIEVNQLGGSSSTNSTVNNQQVNQNIFVGSTAELSKFLKSQK